MANAKPTNFSFDVFDTKTKAENGVEVEILKADGDSSGLFITVLGTDSGAYQKMRERFDRQRIKQMQKGGRNAIDAVYDQAKEHDLQLLAECTIGTRIVDQEGAPFDVKDKDELVSMYRRYPLVQEQVRVAMNDRTLFTNASVKN